MTERPNNTRIHDWLDETVGPTPDPVEGTREVMSQVDETPQAGRWLPFSLFRRKARTPTSTPSTTDTAEYQPSPIPASNGHTPTAIGRTSSMLSPVKAIVTGALVFALGGAFLIAQPFGQQGSVPGAETETAVSEPVPFTMSFVWYNRPVRDGEDVTEGGITRSIGSCNAMAIADPSDPRLDGTLTFCSDEHVYGKYRDQSTIVWTDTYRIVNGDGAWQGSHSGVTWDDLGSGERMEPDGPVILVGEGAYDGLYAAWTGLWSDVHGVIFEGAPPADPIPPIAE